LSGGLRPLVNSFDPKMVKEALRAAGQSHRAHFIFSKQKLTIAAVKAI